MKASKAVQRVRRPYYGVLLMIVAIIIAAGPARTAATPAQPSASHQVYLPLVTAPNSTGASYDVTYTPNTVVLDDNIVADSLISISDDEVTLRFRQSAAKVGTLKPGQVLVVAGRVLRKVQNVKLVGDEYVVQTGAATLNEAIKTGKIVLPQSVEWDTLSLASFPTTMTGEDGTTLYRTNDPGITAGAETSAVVPQGGLDYKGKVQGWEVSLKLEPAQGRLNITVKAEKIQGTAHATVEGTGWIGNLSTETSLQYDNSTATLLSVKALQVQGEMRLQWAAIAPNGDLNNVAGFIIPAEIPIPARVGPIPVTLKVKAALQVVPVMAVPGASSGGDFTATYRSDQGFTVEGNTVTASGQPASTNLRVTGPTASAGYGPVAFGLGVEFPRLELEFFGHTQAFITNKSFASGYFGTEPPCQKGSLKLLAVAGHTLGFLGFNLTEGTKQLWNEEYVKYRDDEPC